MRYLLQCVDGSTKRLSEDEGKKALVAWMANQRFLVQGVGYAPHFVSAIKPMKTWLEEQKNAGKRVCKYGNAHGWGDRCECGSLGCKLLPADERGLASLPEPQRERVALPEAPPTAEEQRKQAAWQELRGRFLAGHAMPEGKRQNGPRPDCQDCGGSGKHRFQGTWITCSCMTGR